MCTTRQARARLGAGVRCSLRQPDGVCAVELVLGLLLGLSVTLAVLPLWTRLQESTTHEADHTIWCAQSRVAAARLERDLRSASAEGAPFAVAGPVLYASSSQVVFLMRKPSTSELLVAEWELVAGALMRRWGPSPAVKPAAFPHSLYTDSKTMLDHVVCGQSGFRYRLPEGETVGPVAPDRLGSVKEVLLTVKAEGRVSEPGPYFSAAVGVGR